MVRADYRVKSVDSVRSNVVERGSKVSWKVMGMDSASEDAEGNKPRVFTDSFLDDPESYHYLKLAA